MFQSIRKFLKNELSWQKNAEGQIAVVIIFFIAIILIFFAIVMNLGKVAQKKNTTMIAANTSAGMLSSLYASYAQSLYMSTIVPVDPSERKEVDGLEYCKSSGWLKTILDIVTTIVVTALIVLTTPIGLSPLIVVAFVVFSAAAVGMQASIYGDFGNIFDKQLENMSYPDQFVEKATMNAMQTLVTDKAVVYDTNDFDMDGLYTDNSGDTIGRFGYWYQQRLDDLVNAKVPQQVIWNFLQALEDFVYGHNQRYLNPGDPVVPRDWGLWDPVTEDPACTSPTPTHPCCTYPPPSVCNKCCLPPTDRESCCDDSNPKKICGQSTTCSEQTHFDGYEYVYDAFHDNPLNNNVPDGFVSFREFLGRDDTHRDYRFDEANPYASQADDPGGVFRRKDITGEIYPLFWRGSHVGLTEQDCLWCAKNPETVMGAPAECYDHFDATDLDYEIDLGGCMQPFTCCLAYYSPSDREWEPGLELWTDAVQDFPGSLAENQCYSSGTGFYKEGDDQYCDAAYPYDENCSNKAVPCDDVPPHINAQYWREDSIDAMVKDLDGFLVWAESSLNMGVGGISQSFGTWYSAADYWLSNNAGAGRIMDWIAEMEKWKSNMKAWRTSNVQLDAGCETMCFPGEYPDGTQCQGHVASATIQDVLTCLTTAYANETDPGRKTRIKFRLDYLQNLYDATEGPVIAKIDEAIAEFKNIAAAFDAVEKAYINWVNATAVQTEKIPGRMIYAWRTAPDKDSGREKGYWHIVRVDAMAPGRCNYSSTEKNKCARKNKNLEPGLPTAKSYKKGGKYCYAIGDVFDRHDKCNKPDDYDDEDDCFYGGTAKVRAIRYDEDRDFVLRFANSSPIWKFILEHPLRGGSGNLVAEMESACGETSPTGKGAFILNDSVGQADCWTAVAKLLERGVMSYSCSEYYYRDVHLEHKIGSFSMKFVECDEGFINLPLR